MIHSRTPGSRQPSPAEENLQRQPHHMDPNVHVGGGFPQHHQLHHILGIDPTHQTINSMQPHLNSCTMHQMPPQMNQLQPPLMNGVGGIHQVPQVSEKWFLLCYYVY